MGWRRFGADRILRPPAGRHRGARRARQRAAGSRAQGETIRRQRAQLDRTIAYSRSIGCQRQRFLIFGAPPPCPMRAARRADRGDGIQSRGARNPGRPLCRRAGRGAARGADGGLQRRMPGPACRPAARLPRVAGKPVRLPARGAHALGGAAATPGSRWHFADGSYRTLCVRKCDGFYFPISMSASRGRFETDSAICQASCPNSEVELFVQPSGQEAESAAIADRRALYLAAQRVPISQGLRPGLRLPPARPELGRGAGRRRADRRHAARRHRGDGAEVARTGPPRRAAEAEGASASTRATCRKGPAREASAGIASAWIRARRQSAGDDARPARRHARTARASSRTGRASPQRRPSPQPRRAAHGRRRIHHDHPAGRQPAHDARALHESGAGCAEALRASAALAHRCA